MAGTRALHTQVHTSSGAMLSISSEQLKRISELVYQHSGIVLGESKRDMVQSRLQKRLRKLNLRSIAEYLQLLEQDVNSEEIPELINVITTNLTSFFREKHHFEHVQHEVMMPALKAGKRLRIWSAGCSVGAEPYSLAMTLHGVMLQHKSANNCDAKILATDVDSNVLMQASSGVYASEWVEKIPPHYRKLYCTPQGKDGEQLAMSDAIRKLITFKQLNLLKPWPMHGKFDAIFCRNVMIYFDKETQKQLFERFADILAEGGILYIGHSETLHNLSNRFVNIGRTTYRKVK